MPEPVLDFAKVTINGGHDDVATEIAVTAGTIGRLPDPNVDGLYYLTWWNSTDYADPSDDPYRERVRVVDLDDVGNTITVVRAQDSTTATAKNISGKTYRMVLAFAKRNYDDIYETIDALTTDDIAEGTNQYFTTERAQDAVGASLANTATVLLAYSDIANQISASVVQGGIDHGSISGLSDDDHPQYHNDARALIWLGTRSTTDLPEGSNLYYTDERAQDAIGGILTDSTEIDFTYNDGVPSITAEIKTASVVYAKIQDVSSSNRILGRSTAGAGTIEEITVGGDIAQSGSTFTIQADVVDNTKLANMAQATIKGRASGAGTGDPTDLTGAQVATIVNASLDHGTLLGLADDDHTQYHTDARALTWLGTRSTTDLPEGSNLYYTDERVDDRVAVLIQNGTGISWVYSDVGGTLTPTISLSPFSTSNLSEGSNLYFTDERAQDAIGLMVDDSANITLTYTDLTPSLVADLIDTGVIAGSYGSTTQVGTFTVDAKGRLTAAANAAISITGIGGVPSSRLLTHTQPAAGFTIATAGQDLSADRTWTYTLANDLAALEGLASTGIAVRSAADTWVQRTITGTADRITLTDGNGVAGNPTIDIAGTYVGQTSITTLGTIATGVWNGTAIGATFGGTGQTTVTTGDLLYGSASNVWSKLADVATGNALISGGVATAPSWGKIGLTTHISGILPIANGGTNASSYTLTNGVIYYNGTSLVNDSDFRFDGTNASLGTTISSTALLNMAKVQNADASGFGIQLIYTVNTAQTLGTTNYIMNVSGTLNAPIQPSPSSFFVGGNYEIYDENNGNERLVYGGNFRVRLSTGVTGGTKQEIGGGVFSAWVDAATGFTATTFFGGKFDAIAALATSAGTVSDGRAGWFRFGAVNASATTVFTTVSGIYLDANTLGSGSGTNWYGINGVLTTVGTAVPTNAYWANFPALMAFTSGGSNQIRAAINIGLPPDGSVGSSNISAGIYFSSSTAVERNGINWNNDTIIYRSAASRISAGAGDSWHTDTSVLTPLVTPATTTPFTVRGFDLALGAGNTITVRGGDGSSGGGDATYRGGDVSGMSGNGGNVAIRGGTGGSSTGNHGTVKVFESDGTTEMVGFTRNVGAVFNEGGESDLDFRVETDNLTHALFVDAGTDQVYIGQSSGASQLDVNLDTRARQFIADGDNAGVASTNSLTNGTDTLGEATVSVLQRSGSGTSAHQGYIKMYVGTGAVYVPYFD